MALALALALALACCCVNIVTLSGREGGRDGGSATASPQSSRAQQQFAQNWTPHIVRTIQEKIKKIKIKTIFMDLSDILVFSDQITS